MRRSPLFLFIAPCLAAEGRGGRTADDVPPKFRGRRLLSLIVGLDGHALAVFRKEDKAGLFTIAFRPPPHWSQIRILITIRRFLSPTVQIRLLHGLDDAGLQRTISAGQLLQQRFHLFAPGMSVRGTTGFDHWKPFPADIGRDLPLLQENEGPDQGQPPAVEQGFR